MIRQELKRLVIEAIHEMPYEEALCEEWGIPPCITLSRVFEALAKQDRRDVEFDIWTRTFMLNRKKYCDWKLVDEDGASATDDNQTNDTIQAVFNLLTKAHG